MSKPFLKLDESRGFWLAVAFAAGLRLPDLFVPYYNIDELTNALFANFILDGRLRLDDFLGNTYLLTHYFYAACAALFGQNTLLPVYGVNLFWTAATAALFYAAGREFSGKREGGFWAAIFYATASVCFMSKDYRAVLSEGLSLLPQAGAALFYFRAVRTGRDGEFFFAGFLIGLAALFKAPAGIIIIALWSSLFFWPARTRFAPFFYSGLGMAAAILLPLFFVASPVEGLGRMLGRVERIQKHYIGAYENLPVLYWGFKYLLRSLLIAASCPLVWTAAFRTLKGELLPKRGGTDLARKKFLILFLFFWFLAGWFVVTLGKRVFYHYFIFTIPPLAFLAVPTLLEWTEKLSKRAFSARRLLVFLLVVGIVVPPLGYTIEAIMGASPRRLDVSKVVDYVASHTRPDEPIFVWGMIPQIYFLAKRDPATTFFWSDTLAGTSPGSPAMEYIRATGRTLSFGESVLRDLKVSTPEKRGTPPLGFRGGHGILDSELLFFSEILERIESPFWKKVFADFFESPPALILDTSPTGIRGFANFPLEKYELLKKFIGDNYRYESTVDGIIIYRLKKKG